MAFVLQKPAFGGGYLRILCNTGRLTGTMQEGDMHGTVGHDVFEPLADTAPLAWRFAPRYCYRDEATQHTCAPYHRIWQYLRLLGVITSVRTNGPHYTANVARLTAGREQPRVLVYGGADYGVMAHVAAGFAGTGRTPEFTVLDRCRTSLFLHRWYGRAAGLPVRLARLDALDDLDAGPFDLICNHSFIHYVPVESRPELMRRWWRLLRPGGSVLTVTRAGGEDAAREGEDRSIGVYTPAQVEDLAARTMSASRAAGIVSDPSPEELGAAARAFAENRRPRNFGTVEEFRSLFESAGFRIEAMAPTPAERAADDRPTRPMPKKRFRYEIHLRRPEQP